VVAPTIQGKTTITAAERILSEWRGPFQALSDVSIMFDRGRVAERQGKRDEAIARYRVVVQMWQRGDPALQPMVAATRDAIR
jgi:hypothetical protein